MPVRTVLLACLLCLSAAPALATRAPAAADPNLPAYQPRQSVAGEITLCGADNPDGIFRRWAADFARFQPGARLRVDPHATETADGMAALTGGRAGVAALAREPFPAETAAFVKKFGHPPRLVCMALGSFDTPHNTDAIAIFVNAANPLRRLTLAQLDAIYSVARRRGAPAAITTWGQLGLGGDWAGRPIHLYGMIPRRATGNPPGVVNFLAQRVLLGGAFQPSVRAQAGRTGTSALAAIVRAVAADPDGIGYGGFANARPGAKTVALAETSAGPYFAGTPATVAAADYPLTRRIYLCVDDAPDRPLPPLLREFLRYVLSREGQDAVAADAAGYLPLPAALAAAERAELLPATTPSARLR